MDHEPGNAPVQIVHLAAGAQAVINGALVTAKGDCEIEVGSGAVVFTGRALWRERDAARNPSEELYFSLLEASAEPGRFAAERYRLFRLLSQVVARERTHEAQRECTFCASALLAGNAEDATKSAGRLASARLETRYRAPASPQARRRSMERMPAPVHETAPLVQVSAGDARY